uniref:Uncharacterized protein n=1 Tax=Arundo donax TaxID=35708 RepID=A0A0A9BZY5_ARUDO
MVCHGRGPKDLGPSQEQQAMVQSPLYPRLHQLNRRQ